MQAVDGVGNTSNDVDVPTITEDSTNPADPVVTTPSGAVSVNSATQTISGTHTENGVTVHAYADSNNDGVADNTTSLGSATVSSNAWSFSVSLTADQANNFVVQAVDGVGNTSNDVDVPTITEDSTNPADPVVTTPSGAISVNSATQTISGTHTEDGVIVHAYADSNNDGVADNTTSLGSATVSSNAWSFSVNLTADQANNFVVQAVDGVGNTSNDVDVPTITEDSTNPADPVVTTPSGAISVNSATQTISGTHTENGVTVHAYADSNNDGVADNTTSLGSATVSSNAWSFSVSLTADSDNNFVLQAADAAGNVSSDVDVPTITEDSTNPADPVVTTPSGAISVNSATQTISGTHTEDGVTVHAYADSNNDGAADNATSLGSATVNSNAWSFSVNLIADQANDFVVQAADAAGNVSSDVDVPTITEDSTNPTVNSTSPTGNSTNVVIDSNITITFSENIVFGTGNIQIIDIDDGSGTVTIDVASPGSQASISNATLTIDPTADLEAGTNYAVQIASTAILDGFNNGFAGISDNTTFNFSTADPTVAFGIATDGQAESEEAQDLPIGLSAKSSKTITVNYTLTGTATGGGTDYTFADGTFTFSPGDQNLTLQLTGIIDDLLDEDDETIILTLSNPTNATLGSQTTLTYTITDNDDAPTVTLSVGSNSIAENSGTSSITATLSAVSSKDVTVNLGYSGTATNGTDYNNTVSSSITINAGQTSANAAIGITSIDDADGEGAETIIVDITGVTNGTENGTQQQTITIIDDDDITAPIGYSVTFDDALIGSGETSTSSFTFAGAEVGSTYNYTVSSDGGGTDVTGSGTISTATDKITMADLSGLGDGTLTLTVTLTDPSSNVGSPVTDNSSLDATAPSAPSVSSISTDSGTNGADEITNDNTLSFNGAAEANSTVELFIGGTSLGTTTADGSGNFSFDHSGTTLSDATYAVTAKATDAAGNTSSASGTLSVTVDTSAPNAPSVTSITNDTGANGTDEVTNDNTLSFNGTSEADAIVEVFIGGTNIGTTQADGSGQWSFNHESTTLSDGTITVTAKATDAAGNTSAESSGLSVTVDTVAPAAPTIDLDPAFDSGNSNSDKLTNNTTLSFTGTAEPNADVEVFINDVSFGVTGADVVGDWRLTTSPLALTGAISVKAVATDQVGNKGNASSILSVTIDTEVSSPILSPADNSVDILPTANLILTFPENVSQTGGSVQIRKQSDDSLLESIDVSSSKVSISGGTVTINPDNNILPPGAEFYVSVSAGAFSDEAGNPFVGILNNTEWSFTIIEASVVSSVSVPANSTYKIGDNLDFTLNWTLPVTITGSPTISVTIGSETVNASLVGTVSNSSTATFRYTVTESDLDADGIAVGSGMALNGGTIKDEFDVDAVPTLNNVASTVAILIDGVRPVPTLSSTAAAVVNDPFTVIFTYDESVSDFELSDITVTNGTAGDFTQLVAGKSWSAEITPTVAGNVVVSLAGGVATDLAGNTSAAGSNTITRQYNNNPTDISMSSKEIDERNAVGDVVGTFSTTDADATDSHSYSLVSGTGDTDNASFTIDGNSLKAAAVFDFETRTSYSIRVKTDDGATGGTFEKAFTISINNVGEAVIVVNGDGAFEMTILGFSDTKTWTVTNNGDAATEVRVVNTTTAFSVTPRALIVGPGESLEVTAVFTPEVAQVYNGQIVFNYTIADTEQANVILPVSGEGVIVTSTDDDLASVNVKFYPNPADKILHVELPNGVNTPMDVQLTDINGQAIFERVGVTTSQIGIDVSGYASGVYIVVLNDGKSILRKKVMIKR